MKGKERPRSLGEYFYPVEVKKNDRPRKGRLQIYEDELRARGLPEEDIEKELKAYVLCTMD
jgi:hypothetical protein